MQVKLLKNIEEGGGVKIVKRAGRVDVVFTEGTVVEVSDTTGAKYIDRGWAEKHESAQS